MLKRNLLIFFSLVIIGLSFSFAKEKAFAEQSGSSPESGASSRLKATYDSLVSLGHGSESAGSWGNWGTMWNRIRSAAEWVPSGDATEADVTSGKTFFGGNRIQKTGTAPTTTDYSTFSKVKSDDYMNGGSSDGDNAGEESIWTNTAGTANGGVWKDSRTGLYWSVSRGSYSNVMTATYSNCDFYTTDPKGSYSGGDSDCEPAINTCAALSLDATGDSSPETDWYLPSQKELQLAYIDGIYNQTNTVFVSTQVFWSPTEVSDDIGKMWTVKLSNGDITAVNGGSSYPVRCVRRD
jgi:hypothetical protein